MKVKLYTGTISSTDIHDSWEKKSRAYASPGPVEEWLLRETLRMLKEGVWGRNWVCQVQSQDIFTQDYETTLHQVVCTDLRRTLIFDPVARARKLQETGLHF